MLENKNKGFTLIEVIVVCAIVILLAVLVIPTFNSSSQTFALDRSAVKLAQDIRWAQQMAMSSRESTKCVGKYVYGVSFDKNKPNEYYLFADCNGNKTYQAADELIKKETLESNVSFNIPNNIDIAFIPPDPTVVFTPSDTSVSIVLKNNQGEERRVVINKVGLIEAQ